jgi:hypothetical protein
METEHLKITFRRCFQHILMLQWYEILEIARTTHYFDEKDALLWKFESNGIFSVKFMYAVINSKGLPMSQLPEKFLFLS